MLLSEDGRALTNEGFTSGTPGQEFSTNAIFIHSAISTLANARAGSVIFALSQEIPVLVLVALVLLQNGTFIWSSPPFGLARSFFTS